MALDLALLGGHLDIAKMFVRDGAGLDTAYPVRILQDGHVRKCIVCGHLLAFHILHMSLVLITPAHLFSAGRPYAASNVCSVPGQSV